MRASQVLSECPCCRVECALVELIDPSERVPVPIEGRCRLCGYRTDLGDVTHVGHRFAAPEDVVAALKETGLKEVFQEVVASFVPLAAKKNVSIRTKTMDVIARFDEDRMKQVMTNLLSNALNFSPDSGNILVTLECRGGDAYGFVEDMGVRIPEDERENIFKQYYTKNVAGGTGLGLTICRGIIEAHGGEIGVEDSHLGGSRFWFRIPTQGKE